MTAVEQRNRAMKALRRMGISSAEIGEVVGMPNDQVCHITVGVEPRPLNCCDEKRNPQIHETLVVGRQLGHHADDISEAKVPITRVKT